jgi:hypothetical protein
VSGPDAGFEEAPYRFHLYAVDRRPRAVALVQVATGEHDVVPALGEKRG